MCCEDSGFDDDHPLKDHHRSHNLPFINQNIYQLRAELHCKLHSYSGESWPVKRHLIENNTTEKYTFRGNFINQ